jgi:hypothetical protein
MKGTTEMKNLKPEGHPTQNHHRYGASAGPIRINLPEKWNDYSSQDDQTTNCRQSSKETLMKREMTEMKNLEPKGLPTTNHTGMKHLRIQSGTISREMA